MDSVKICVVGWHFFEDFYRKLKKCSYEKYIVGHRYNKILDELNLDYTITKNIGLEFGAYHWYIKNKWDGQSGVIFIHDDTSVEDGVLDEIVDRCKGSNMSYITGKSKGENQEYSQKYSPRCFYLSKKLIKCYIKKYGNIWYDKKNKGYTMSQKVMHEEKYGYNNVDACLKFKKSINFLMKKHKLKFHNFRCKGFLAYRRGTDENYDKDRFDDNSIFGREDNLLEELCVKYKNNKRRDDHFYTKWYRFYFNSLRHDRLNILEISTEEDSLLIWKKYFNNSFVYGEKDTIKIKDGIDIVIDSRSNVENRIDTFKYLFKKLNPAGIYVIEDLHNSYGKGAFVSIVDFLKGKIDDVNFYGKYDSNNIENIFCKYKGLSYYEKNISSICFHPGICFIFKR